MAAVGGGQAAPPPKADMAPVLQQLNLASLRTRTQDLHNAISRILHAFTTQPSLKWWVYLLPTSLRLPLLWKLGQSSCKGFLRTGDGFRAE
jgi:hypothetical protein